MAPARVDGLLALKGVIVQDEALEVSEAARAARDAALLETLATALDALARARAMEGHKLAAVLTAQMDEIARLTKEAAGLAATQPAALREKLGAQVKEMLNGGAVSEERLAQEVALLAVKGRCARGAGPPRRACAGGAGG